MSEHDQSDSDDDRALGPRLGDAWPTSTPPAGFSDRVVAARRARLGRARRWPRLVAAALTAGLLTSATSWALWRVRSLADGAQAVSARASIAIGRRGTAVAEAGAALEYHVGFGGDATVTQSRGDVFYRIERGGSFDVTTPLAQIHVTGTCFRLEVIPMNIKPSVIGAALGAAAASAVVVTVYEGKVEVRNAHGATPVAAGESFTTTGTPSSRPPRFAAVTPPRAGLESPRQEIARLKDRIAELEGRQGIVVEERVKVSGDKETAGDKPELVPEEKFLDFTRAEWADMASRCEVRTQLPPLGMGGEPAFVDEKEANQVGLSPDERSRYNDQLRAASDEHRTALAAIYRDITGESGDRLTLMSLDSEIRAKSPPSEFSAANRRFAEEKAGINPGQDPATFSPIDRFIRLQANAWQKFEEKLMTQLGPEKTHALRERQQTVRIRTVGCR
jgi:hypothetical protein